MKKIIYHGSEVVVRKPVYGYISENGQDFGPGFYCTEDEILGKEWASRGKSHYGINNKYELDTNGLKILDLTSNDYSVLNWLAVIFHFRNDSSELKYIPGYHFLEKYYIDISDYDVVIGYRADDRYFTFPKAFVMNELTLKSVEKVFLEGGLGKQIFIKSEKAFSQLKFISIDQSTPGNYYSYLNKIKAANALFDRLKKQDFYVIEGKISYLIMKGKENV